MPRIRKTSTQPKRKAKPTPVKLKPVYPDFIQNFINEVEEKTKFTVVVSQYAKDSSYNVGVLQKIGKTSRCIWMASYATEAEHLKVFWSSLAMKEKP